MPTQTSASQPMEALQCMQIWGGNSEIDNGVSLAGIDCWVYSRPFQGAAAQPAAAGEAGVSATSSGSSTGGGDIHFVTSCATGRITRLVVADVSGHGAPVAEMATSLRRLMRRHANHYDQRLFVRSVNERFSELMSPGSASESGVFATAVFASFYAPTDEFSLCNAGHPRPLHYDARSAQWRAIEVAAQDDRREIATGTRTRSIAAPSNLPLGIIEDTHYDQHLFRLGHDDLVLVYTDSLVELRRAAAPGTDESTLRRPMLGEAGLIEICSRLDPSRPGEFVPELLRALEAYSGLSADAFDDDVTVLLLKRNDLKPRPSVALSFKGATNIFRGLIEAIRGDVPPSIPELSVKAIFGTLVSRLNKPMNPRDRG